MQIRFAVLGKVLPLILAIVGISAAVMFWPVKPTTDVAAGDWTCSMHPQIRLPKPGRCPICGMDLIPVTQLAAAQAKTRQQAGIETAPVEYRELFKEIRTVGKLDYNESRVAYIAARIDGRVDRIYADFTGIHVNAEDHLVDIYSPTLYTGQSELFILLNGLRRAGGNRSEAEALVESAREKLRLLGILPKQLQQIEDSGKIATHLTIYAPIGGTIVEKNVREGQYVKEGDMLFRIADLDPIWLYLDIYESDLGWVRHGQQVDVTVEAYATETFTGKVTFIDPFLNDKTRTVKVRVNLKNPDLRLKPSMYASALIRVRLREDGTPEPTGLEGKYICPMHPEVVEEKPGRCPRCGMPLERVPDAKPLVFADGAHATADGDKANQTAGKPSRVLSVPSSAVLDTGRRKIVYRHHPDGTDELVDVRVGPRAETIDETGRPASYFPVMAGLKQGDQVIVRGGFLLDSQRQIEGQASLIYPQGQSGVNLHAGHGGPPPVTPAAPQPQHQH